MDLINYERQVREAITNKKDNPNFINKLCLRDNYSLLLNQDLKVVAQNFKFLNDFELIRADEGWGFFRFNYKPGTVFADLSNWQDEDDFVEEESGLVGEVLEARKKIHRDYKTRIMLHTEQGEGPEKSPGLFNPGMRMNAPEGVAVGLSLLTITEMIKKENSSLCLPRRFYQYPHVDYLAEIVWHNS